VHNLEHGAIVVQYGSKVPKSTIQGIVAWYAASPLAMIVEQAGGAASNGTRRILDLQPTELHERTPLFIGSKSDVGIATSMLSDVLTGVGG